MKVLILYDNPPPPAGLATQGHLLQRGLHEIGVEAMPAHFESALDKEWTYSWFKPDVVVGVGYWGHIPDIVLHPQASGMLAVPWLVADGFIANYQQVLNDLPLILVTSNWVKDVYIRDGIRGDNIEVLPVGCDTDKFYPIPQSDPKVAALRQIYNIQPDELMILTVGGDAASKGAQEVMKALGKVDEYSASNKNNSRGREPLPPWKYICKVWPQPRTFRQNKLDLKLASRVGIADRVTYSTDRMTRDFMPYLFSACDIYAAPSRLEGFGMSQVEAGACGKPVVAIAAMGMLDTLVHGETALLARIGEENYIEEAFLGAESGFPAKHRYVFPQPRIADYRADVEDLARHLDALIRDPGLRHKLGEAGRKHAIEHFDYRLVAKQFVEILSRRLNIS